MPCLPPTIYAELLPNIQRISLVVTLSRFHGNAVVSLSKSGDSVSIVNDGVEIASLPLPGRSRVTGALTLPPALLSPSKLPRNDDSIEGEVEEKEKPVICTWRLPWAGPSASSPSSTMRITAITTDDEEKLPWLAADLPPSAQLSCASCVGDGNAIVESARDQAVIVEQGQIKVWKDLPSENWAEMMEFWHCHKPVEHHRHGNGHGHEGEGKGECKGLNGERVDAHGDTTAGEMARGYGASTAISAQQGVGFVDIMTLLISVEDCRDVLYSNSDAKGSPRLATFQKDTEYIFCAACQTLLGQYKARKDAIALFKWQISVSNPPPSVVATPTLAHCLAASLTAAQANSGSAKSVLVGTSERIVKLWVLNRSLRYSSSARPPSSLGVAMKVLYKTGRKSEITDAEEEILLPDGVIDEVWNKVLSPSSKLLPEGERIFKPDWCVGLIDRWEGPD